MELTIYDRDESPVFVPADALGDTFLNNGDVEAIIFNTSGSPRTVTVPSRHKCSHGFFDDLQEVIGAGVMYRLGPFAASRFSSSQLRVTLNYDDPTGVSVAIQRLR